MTRAAYVALLDLFLAELGTSVSQGMILGFEDRHGEALMRLIRYRPCLDAPDPGRRVRELDAIRDVEGALARLREGLSRAR